MATMKDIARKSGVSLGTVSNVLNNLPSVKPKNRDKVIAAVNELGYSENLTARTLRTRLSKSIGLIIPSITNPFYPEFARGVEDAAREAGFTVFLCNNDRDGEKERKYIKELCSKSVDGIILIRPTIDNDEADAILERCALVFVGKNRHIENRKTAQYSTIDIDERGGTEKAMNLLYKNGHYKIAFINIGSADSISVQGRYNSYIQYMEDKKLEFRKEYMVEGDYTCDGGYAAMMKLLTLRDPPTAVFCANDIMAFGAIKACLDIGCKVPDDISIIGFDNIDLAKNWTPSLTTLNQPKYEIGQKSVFMLLEQLRRRANGTPKGETIRYNVELIKRDSVGKNLQ